MKPHRTIANRPMSVAACDMAWPNRGGTGAFACGFGGKFLIRIHGFQPTCRPPRMSDSPESDIPATCDAAKHQQLVINVAFHATIFRLHCDSQPNFATQPTVARREVDFTGLLRQ